VADGGARLAQEAQEAPPPKRRAAAGVCAHAIAARAWGVWWQQHGVCEGWSLLFGEEVNTICHGVAVRASGSSAAPTSSVQYMFTHQAHSLAAHQQMTIAVLPSLAFDRAARRVVRNGDTTTSSSRSGGGGGSDGDSELSSPASGGGRKRRRVYRPAIGISATGVLFKGK